MKKKFGLRLKRYSGAFFCIQYSHYYFFPIWRNLQKYLSVYKQMGIYIDNDIDHLEMFAKTFRTMEDVKEYESGQRKLLPKSFNIKRII